MASIEELDLDVQQKPAGKKHLILYIVIGLLVLALGAATAVLLMRGGHKTGGTASAGGASGSSETQVRATHYLPIDKLVVNFGENSPVRFLQVDLQVMAYDPAALKVVQDNMPEVRNDILMLLAGQSYSAVSTPAGKETLRGEILGKVQHIVDQNAKGEKVDAVYFTEFVMQ